MSGYYQPLAANKPHAHPFEEPSYIGAFGILAIILGIIFLLVLTYYALKFYCDRKWDEKPEENMNNYAHLSDTLPLGDYKKTKGKDSTLENKEPATEHKIRYGFNMALLGNGPTSHKDYLVNSDYKNGDMNVDQPDHHSVHSLNETDESSISPSPSTDQKEVVEDTVLETRISQTELSVPLRKDEIETTI
ncbi:uncharacterized protein LOC136036023 isoform X2 [Artemia franciscana]